MAKRKTIMPLEDVGALKLYNEIKRVLAGPPPRRIDHEMMIEGNHFEVVIYRTTQALVRVDFKTKQQEVK